MDWLGIKSLASHSLQAQLLLLLARDKIFLHVFEFAFGKGSFELFAAVFTRGEDMRVS